jgi:hypothetical protein
MRSLPTRQSSIRPWCTRLKSERPLQRSISLRRSRSFNESFHYVRELTSDRDAVLEFELELDGIKVNEVDMIKWNDARKIVEFKVMLRPLKTVNLIDQKMAAMLKAKP